jgi:hypothetical protein
MKQMCCSIEIYTNFSFNRNSHFRVATVGFDIIELSPAFMSVYRVDLFLYNFFHVRQPSNPYNSMVRIQVQISRLLYSQEYMHPINPRTFWKRRVYYTMCVCWDFFWPFQRIHLLFVFCISMAVPALSRISEMWPENGNSIGKMQPTM